MIRTALGNTFLLLSDFSSNLQHHKQVNQLSSTRMHMSTLALLVSLFLIKIASYHVTRQNSGAKRPVPMTAQIQLLAQ